MSDIDFHYAVRGALFLIGLVLIVAWLIAMHDGDKSE